MGIDVMAGGIDVMGLEYRWHGWCGRDGMAGGRDGMLVV